MDYLPEDWIESRVGEVIHCTTTFASDFNVDLVVQGFEGAGEVVEAGCTHQVVEGLLTTAIHSELVVFFHRAIYFDNGWLRNKTSLHSLIGSSFVSNTGEFGGATGGTVGSDEL